MITREPKCSPDYRSYIPMNRNDGLDSKIDKLIATPKSYDEFASIMPKGDAMPVVPANGASMEHTQ